MISSFTQFQSLVWFELLSHANLNMAFLAWGEHYPRQMHTEHLQVNVFLDTVYAYPSYLSYHNVPTLSPLKRFLITVQHSECIEAVNRHENCLHDSSNLCLNFDEYFTVKVCASLCSHSALLSVCVTSFWTVYMFLMCLISEASSYLQIYFYSNTIVALLVVVPTMEPKFPTVNLE